MYMVRVKHIGLSALKQSKTLPLSKTNPFGRVLIRTLSGVFSSLWSTLRKRDKRMYVPCLRKGEASGE